jgi:hypothetical protein
MLVVALFFVVFFLCGVFETRFGVIEQLLPEVQELKPDHVEDAMWREAKALADAIWVALRYCVW